MRRRRRAAVVLCLAVVSGGCSTPERPAEKPVERAEALWSARSTYVGDASRVVALVSAIGVAPGGQGAYTLSLETEQPPYGATVALTKSEKTFGTTDFGEPATLLIGLVGNLDHVRVTFAGQTYTLTAADASKARGYDVKDLGRDRGKLAAYLRSRQD